MEKIKYCKDCKKNTEHIQRGFGTPGSFVGNARIECRVCGRINN